MNIYVGNLSFRTTEDDLREVFEKHGKVDSVSIIVDKLTNRSRGFGFVEMENSDEGQAAIAAINGKELDERVLRINEARPKPEKRARW